MQAIVGSGSRRRRAAGLALALLAGAGPLVAHTREKERIDAVEAEATRQNALLTQQVKDAVEADAQLGEAIKERAEHARFLDEKLEALKAEVRTGLAGIREGVGRTVDEKLGELERRLEGATGAQLGSLAEAQAVERDRLRQELGALQLTLSQFRTYLTSFAANIDARFVGLRGEVQGLRQEQTRDREAAEQRMQALLKAVNDENLKLRQAMTRLAGGTAPAPGLGGVRKHQVKQGESLFAISRLYGVSIEALKKANPDLAKPNAVVRPGSEIVVPGP